MSLQQIRTLTSDSIRAIALHLYHQQIPVTYFGMAWSGATNNWIYFDTCLDIEALRAQFEQGASLEFHENLDPKSGTERGLIDKNTGEGIMGRIADG